MASNVVVVDSTFKQTKIKVTAMRPMREILEEACQIRKLDPDSYSLKTQSNKTVDLSQPFRLSGLSAGARLQLTQASRSAGVVNIALQLPEVEGGGRLSDKFPSTTSLWLVLRKYEDAVAGKAQRRLNLTQRAVPSKPSSGSGRLEYEQPVLNLLGRNLETFADLQKTLSQLGINNGAALIRLSFRSSGQPLEEAMKQIEQHFSGVETTPNSLAPDASPGLGDTKMAMGDRVSNQPTNQGPADDQAVPSRNTSGDEPQSIQQVEKDPPPAALSETQLDTTEPVQSPPGTVDGITVFRPPSSSTPAATLQPDDASAFDPTVDDARAHQAALQRLTRNTRLLSDKEIQEREHEHETKLALIQEFTARVRYPDQSMIELTVKASDTAAQFYKRITSTLEVASEPFEIRFAGAKGQQILPRTSSRRLIRDFGLKGRVLFTLNWSTDASARTKQSPCLKQEFRSQARDLQIDLQAQRTAGEENHRTAMAKQDRPGPGAGASQKGKGDLESKLKKFIGFGKK